MGKHIPKNMTPNTLEKWIDSDEMARRVIQFIEKGHPLDEAVDIVKPRKRKEVVTTDVYQYRDSPCTMCGSFYGHWSNCGVSKP